MGPIRRATRNLTASALLLANGGPGLPCDYLRDSHSHLADRGYRAHVLRGSGIVVAQSPAPGTAADAATVCKLRLGERTAALAGASR